jgi:pimeloyl-ACP methyl ester carboxylesterase
MSDVGHPALDFGLPFRGILRLLPARVPIGTLARLGAPFATLLERFLRTSISELGWHEGNANLRLLRALMLTAVDDLPASLLREFARWYETKAMSDRYGMFDFTEHLERITTPILIIAGSQDGLTPPRDLEHVYQRIASRDKVFRIIGKKYGDARDYSHADLILGLHAPADVYPIVLHWLETHRQTRPARRRATVHSLRPVQEEAGVAPQA